MKIQIIFKVQQLADELEKVSDGNLKINWWIKDLLMRMSDKIKTLQQNVSSQ